MLLTQVTIVKGGSIYHVSMGKISQMKALVHKDPKFRSTQDFLKVCHYWHCRFWFWCSLEHGGSLFHLHLQMVCRLKITSLNFHCTRRWKLHWHGIRKCASFLKLLNCKILLIYFLILPLFIYILILVLNEVAETMPHK